MSIKLSTHLSYEGKEDGGIGANSLDTSTRQIFVKKASNVVDKATSADTIVGVSLTQKTFAADNQTNAKLALNFIPKEDGFNLYDVTITGGTINATKERHFYNLSDEVTVDGTSESTTSGQLQMIKFLSATNCRFRIV